MSDRFLDYLTQSLAETKTAGLYKCERSIASPQNTTITLEDGREVINFCANNYLGLADHPNLIKRAQKTLDEFGFGMASVRFICGTQTCHKTLEHGLSKFLGTDDTILYSSCFDANTGLFETLLSNEDAIISDSLNHASIIDGVRLCKAKRFRYANNDMTDLEKQLKASLDCRFRLIATDGVFSMDGIIANLPVICDKAEKYDALVMVDDSHAVGFMGKTGAGTPEHCGVSDRIDIVTGTLGKALGGASGGYTSGHQPIIDWLRQRSRPYLFSNSIAPMVVGAALEALEMLSTSDSLRATLMDNSAYFRSKLTALGFELVPGEHPIIPIMLGEATLANDMADALLKEGIYVIGFSFPVVPKGMARIRTQISAAHTKEQLDKAIHAFEKIGRNMGII